MIASKPYSIMVIVLVLLFSKILCAPSSELNEHRKSLAENQDTTVSNLVKNIKQAWQHLDESWYSPVDAKKLKQYMAGILFHFKYDLFLLRAANSVVIFQKKVEAFRYDPFSYNYYSFS
jgi:hypothetical protein